MLGRPYFEMDQDFALPAQQAIKLSLQLEQSILELMTWRTGVPCGPVVT